MPLSPLFRLTAILSCATLIIFGALNGPTRGQTPQAPAAPTKIVWKGYVWYQPYEQLVRMDTRFSRDTYFPPGGTMHAELTDAGGKVVWETDWPANGHDRAQKQMELPEGTYKAHGIWKGDNNETLGEFSNDVLVKTYAFMHNTIGEERIVVPPFDKITASGNKATAWGRTFTFASNGLPSQINATGQDLFASRARIVLRHGAQEFDLEAVRPLSIQTKDGYDATGTSSGKIGGLNYQLDGRLEYDGTYFIRLVIDGQGVPVDSLALELDLADVDTFSAQKNDKDSSQNYGFSRFMGIKPGQTGTLFDARELPSKFAYNVPWPNSFIPAIYAGTGTRGLWFYAEDDWDWYINPDKEQTTLKRESGRTILRIPFVNDSTTWSGKRTIEFALLPQPVKPLPPGWRKTAWGYPSDQYLHDTAGWRYYGDGVDAFTLPTDQDFENLAKVVSGEAPYPPHASPNMPIRRPGDHRPLVFYGSGLMAGGGVAEGEWDSFGAEWGGASWAQAPTFNDVKKRFLGKTSRGGYPWTADVSFKPTAVTWDNAWLDFQVYYYEKLARFVGLNGTFFDNQSGFLIPAYNQAGLLSLQDNPNRFDANQPAEQRPRGYGMRSQIFQFRTILKRLVTMCQVDGVQPFWMVNQQPTRSFAQIDWHIESDYYVERGQRDLIDHYGGPGQGLAGYRAHVCTMGGLINRLEAGRSDYILPPQSPVEGRSEHYVVHLEDTPAFLLPGVTRTHVGMCLVTDVGFIRKWNDPQTGLLLKTLDQKFGFFNDDVQSAPYWDQHEIQALAPNFYVTLFKRKKAHLALAVVFNENIQAGVTDLTIASPIDDISPVDVRDMETGEPLVDLQKDKGKFRTKLYVPGHNMRLILIGGPGDGPKEVRANAGN